jgi:hypothetical protein
MMGLGWNLPKNADVRTYFARYFAPAVDWRDVARVTIDLLPDVALLEIFDFHVKEHKRAWYTLVHVCRKWRNVILGSPRRLDQRLFCRPKTPIRKKLDLWPPLPIELTVCGCEIDEIVAALEYNNRICKLDVINPSFPEEKFLPAMQRAFPSLTVLVLWLEDEIAPLDPDSFLGGSAPRLQSLILEHIPFPGLPNLLLSTTRIVDLDLWNIPHSGYISPKAMVTCLSALTRLERFYIGFESPRSCPDRSNQRPPSLTRSLLPVLTVLWFKGVCEYLEELVSRIDAPLLDDLAITFFHQLIFDTPRITQFISSPKFKAHHAAHVKARVAFSSRGVSVTLPRTFDDGKLTLEISCSQSDWQLSSLAQVCSSSFPQALIPTVEQLYIEHAPHMPMPLQKWQDYIESSQWLELLHPFTAVKDLYISSEFTSHIVSALQELIGERTTEVLPVLHSLFLEETLPSGPTQEAVGQFVAARQLASRPITVSHWERRF